MLTSPTAVDAGGYHTCALANNAVQRRGYNTNGQTVVPTLVNPVAVTAGGEHTCALDDSGVHCWGYNAFGANHCPNAGDLWL